MDKIDKLYKDPQTGFIGINEIYRKNKDNKTKITYNQEFGTEDINQFILTTKRERKPRKRFIEEI